MQQVRGIQVAPLIGAARRAAGMSAEQLAEELGVERTTIRRLETGRRTPTRIEINAIANVINTSTAPIENRIRRARVDGRIVELGQGRLDGTPRAPERQRQRPRRDLRAGAVKRRRTAMKTDEIRINPATGGPYEELAFYLAVSDRVKEHLEHGDIVRAFGVLLEDRRIDDDEADGHIVDIDGVKVRFVLRDDGGWSMTLADDEEAER